MGWYIPLETIQRRNGYWSNVHWRFGEDWEEFEIAHLATSDGTGIELFSFPHGVKEAPEFNPFNTGLFHFCIQDPNIEDLIAKIVSYGGKQRMPIREYYPREPLKMCYVEDPFGIVFEIYTQLRTNLFFRSLHKINQ
jgi:catechol 2,3-dioxygenase-like lactoylglutathione lyase family enzyme